MKNWIYFKLLTLTVLTLLCLSPQMTFSQGDDGFKPLFNGKDLTGWDGNTVFWSFQDGMVVGQTTEENPTNSNTFLIWRIGTVDNFELKFQYRLVGGNSGFQYRSREVADWVLSGYQADFEAGDTYSGILYEEKARGILALRGEKAIRTADGKKRVYEKIADTADLQKVIKKEDWNEYHVIARGNHFWHYINGQLMMEFIDRESDKAAETGLIGFQVHAGPPMLLQVKDVKMKRLPLEDKTKVVLIAGKPSHPPLHHEYNASVQLLKKLMDQNMSDEVMTTYYLNGWPLDPTALDNADAIFLYMDGFDAHELNNPAHLEQLREHMAKGRGLALLHYAVGGNKDTVGKAFIDWIGGNFEQEFSDYPHWDADLKFNHDHPIANGVHDQVLLDEWYFNMRFRPEMEGVTSLLKATPPDEKRSSEASKEHMGRAEMLAWCVEREDGGRGFGFTGGHYHLNWQNDDLRKFVLNALVWTSGAKVPENGVESTVEEKDLYENLDDKSE